MRTIIAIAVITIGVLPLGSLPAAGQDNPGAVQPEQSAPKQVQRHSHTREKSGAPEPQPSAGPNRSSPKTPLPDKSKHFHPRDR